MHGPRLSPYSRCRRTTARNCGPGGTCRRSSPAPGASGPGGMPPGPRGKLHSHTAVERHHTGIACVSGHGHDRIPGDGRRNGHRFGHAPLATLATAHEGKLLGRAGRANAPKAASVILIHHFDIVASARNGRRGIAPNPNRFTLGDSRFDRRRSLIVKIGLGNVCLELFGTIANSPLSR